jgi:hypothetical protein
MNIFVPEILMFSFISLYTYVYMKTDVPNIMNLSIKLLPRFSCSAEADFFLPKFSARFSLENNVDKRNGAQRRERSEKFTLFFGYFFV